MYRKIFQSSSVWLLALVLVSCGFVEVEASDSEVDRSTITPGAEGDKPSPETRTPAGPAEGQSLEDQAENCLAAAAGQSADEDFATVLACFDEVRSRQVPLSDREADRLNAECVDYGGLACTELLLRSYEEDHQLMGLACGGRSPEIPCPEGPVSNAADTSAPAEQDTVEEAQPEEESAAQFLAEFISGNVVLYSTKDVNRPIYGWKDFTYITYCTDGRFLFESQGERKTVLDNTEYRSHSGQGRWVALDLPDGSVIAELQFDDGAVGGFVLWPGPNGLQHDASTSSEIWDLAGC